MLWQIRMLTAGLREEEKNTLRFACEELKRYLAQVEPGTVLLGEGEGVWEGWLNVGVGLSDRLAQVENPRLDDAIFIDVAEKRGLISGVNARSVLIAVYRFLKELGFAFLRPGKDGELCPSTLPEKPVRVNERASYRHRGICIEGSLFYESVEDIIDWIPKASMNGYFVQFFVPQEFFKRWYDHRENPYLQSVTLTEDDVAAMMKPLERQIRLRGLLYHGVGHGWTCKPFGLPATGWEKSEISVPEEAREALAMIGGKRELFGGVALNTNLCYGNPAIRNRMTDTIVDYCRAHAEVDYLHVWLADGKNNNCECERCRDHRPADLYVTMLNELDAKLTAQGIETRIVFLIYVDLLWPPTHARLENPDRFVLMFAPITRSYTTPFAENRDAPITPYVRNRLKFPRGAGESIAYLKAWKKMFDGDCFAFDYYYMWDCYKDLGYTKAARMIHTDIRSYADLQINGLVSCQGQRVFLPTALGMQVMARTLWDRDCDFDAVRDEVLSGEFGESFALVRDFLADLSGYGTPEVIRLEKPIRTAENVALYEAGLTRIRQFRTVVRENVAQANGMRRQSWENLRLYLDVAQGLLGILLLLAKGEPHADAVASWVDLLNRIEWDCRRYYDIYLLKDTICRRFLGRLPK